MAKQAELTQLHGSLREADWHHAASLAERLAAWRANGSPSRQNNINRKLAERRFKRWRENAPFENEELFAQRLAMQDLSEQEFRQLLGETVETVRDRLPENPDWLLKLQDAYSNFADDGSEPELQHDNLIKFVFANKALDEADPDSSQEALYDERVAGFLNLVRPLLRQGLAQLREAVHALAKTSPEAPFDPEHATTMLFARLPGKLLRLISRTLVLEMNVARMRGDLVGETPEARFACFAERLRDREAALAILREYPVLARQLVLVIDNWCSVSLD